MKKLPLIRCCSFGEGIVMSRISLSRLALAIGAAAVVLSSRSAIADSISDTLTITDGNIFTAISKESGSETGFIALPQQNLPVTVNPAFIGRPTVLLEPDGSISDIVGIRKDPSGGGGD